MRQFHTKQFRFLQSCKEFLALVVSNFWQMAAIHFEKYQVTQMARGVFTIGGKLVYKSHPGAASIGFKAPVFFQAITIRPRYV